MGFGEKTVDLSLREFCIETDTFFVTDKENWFFDLLVLDQLVNIVIVDLKFFVG